MTRDQAITALGLITMILGITSIINSCALTRARTKFDALEKRLNAVEWIARTALTNAIPWTTNTGPFYLHDYEPRNP